MFIINWVFDKLGYMPKINVDAGAVAAWPFPGEDKDFFGIPREPKTKPVVKKKPAAKKASKAPAAQTTLNPQAAWPFPSAAKP